MKTFFLVLIMTTAAWAGPRVNNGGGAWVCREDDGAVRWIRSVDLFESDLYGRHPRLVFEGLPSRAIYEDRLSFIRARLPELRGLLDRHELDLSKVLRLEPVELPIVADAFITDRPRRGSCRDGRVGYEQVADFVLDQTLVVNQALWGSPKMSEADRAALLLHERIYYALRREDEDASSWRARWIVHLLFRNVPVGELCGEIESILHNTPHESARQPVILFPVNLRCRAAVESRTPTENGLILTPREQQDWLDFDEGSAFGVELDGFRFSFASSREDGRPIELRVEHLATGIFTEASEPQLMGTFRSERLVGVALTTDRGGTQASLECWTQ